MNVTTTTPDAALAVLRRLAYGLGSGDDARLLERASLHDEAEVLRAALAELGARALLAASGTSTPGPGTTRLSETTMDRGENVKVTVEAVPGGVALQLVVTDGAAFALTLDIETAAGLARELARAVWLHRPLEGEPS
jgi:ABC-type phosphate transport system substrate-binding protein